MLTHTVDPFVIEMLSDLGLSPEQIRAFTTQSTRKPEAAHAPNPAPSQTLSDEEAAC